MNFQEGGGGSAAMPQELLSDDAFLDTSTVGSAASAVCVIAAMSGEAHPDEDFMLMGGYGEAEVPDGMRSLVGNAASPYVPQCYHGLCHISCLGLRHVQGNR